MVMLHFSAFLRPPRESIGDSVCYIAGRIGWKRNGEGDAEAKEGLSADFLFVFWLALRACQKYSAILHTKTSNKLFIIQLLYLKGIS